MIRNRKVAALKITSAICTGIAILGLGTCLWGPPLILQDSITTRFYSFFVMIAGGWLGWTTYTRAEDIERQA